MSRTACTLTPVGAFFALGRALRLTTFRSFLPAASALFAGTLLVVAIVFGPEGVRPSDVVHAMERWPTMRLGFWVLWVILSWPVSARLVEPTWIRTLPVRTSDAVIWMVLTGLLAQTPWMLLFAIGESPQRGLANGLLALPLGFALATGSRALFAASAVVALTPVPAWIALPVGALLATLAARLAWVAGPREQGLTPRLVPRAPSVVAIALAALADLARGNRIILWRGVALAAAVAAALRLLSVNQPTDPASELARTLAVLALPSAAVAVWISAPIHRLTAGLEPLVMTLGRPARVLRLGAAFAVFVLLVVFGASGGARLGGLAAVRGAAWSAAIGLATLSLSGGREPSSGVLVAAVVGAAALAIALATESMALPLVLLATSAVTLRDWR